jgi:hypothetical protein
VDFTLSAEEKPKLALQFFKRVCDILEKENIQFDKAVLIKLVEKFFPDFRRTLNELQRYARNGKIDASVLTQIADVKNIGDLIKSLKEKDFRSVRKWVVLNSDIDPARIYRKIYDGLYEFLKPASIPQAVVIIARYQYQAAFVADQEINLIACLTEIMVETEQL